MCTKTATLGKAPINWQKVSAESKVRAKPLGDLPRQQRVEAKL